MPKITGASILWAALLIPAAYASPIGSTSASTFAGAQNVNGFFSLNPLANVQDSTTIPHVEISQTGRTGAGFDFYRFTHGGGIVHLDVDGPFFVDIEMGIWTIGGTLLANNDDNGLDPGSTSVQDPAIFNLSLAAGDYIVGLCRYNCVFQSGSPYMTASPGGSGEACFRTGPPTR